MTYDQGIYQAMQRGTTGFRLMLAMSALNRQYLFCGIKEGRATLAETLAQEPGFTPETALSAALRVLALDEFVQNFEEIMMDDDGMIDWGGDDLDIIATQPLTWNADGEIVFDGSALIRKLRPQKIH